MLLRECLATGNYERVFFLSGLCYPLLGKRDFDHFFEQHADTEFVCGWNLTQGGDKLQNYRVGIYHLFRDIPLQHNSLLRRIVIVGTRVLLRTLGLHKLLWVTLADGRKWDVYYGTSWMSMTTACASYVLQTLDQHKEIDRYFRTAYAPDELMIPTIVHNSPFAARAIKCEDKDFQNLTPLHYVHYTDHIWAYDENDYDDIMQSGRVFVRKLVSGKSERLIELLDANKH